jgi:hypothetical protein
VPKLSSTLYRSANICRDGCPTNNAALGLDHCQGCLLKLGEVALCCILHEQTLVAAIVGIAHGGVDADIGGNACQNKDLGTPPWSEPSLFISHALVKTTVTPEIRQSQLRLILAPIAQALQTTLGSPPALRLHLQKVLQQLKTTQPHCGYGVGNLINLARYLSLDLAGLDFSGLSLWHANLQGTTLPGVNFANCQFAHTVFTQIFAGVLTLAYSPDGTTLAWGDASGAVHLWQIAKGELLLSLKQHRGWIWSLAWSPDGQTLATGGDDKTIKLWDAHSGEVLRILPETNAVWSLAWSPDGHTLASGSFAKTVNLWDPGTGICRQTLVGHGDLVTAVAWKPDSSILASGSLDGTLKFWDGGTGDWVWSVDWCPVGNDSSAIVASGSDDKPVKLWDMASGDCVNTLQGCTLGFMRWPGVPTSGSSPEGRKIM